MNKTRLVLASIGLTWTMAAPGYAHGPGGFREGPGLGGFPRPIPGGAEARGVEVGAPPRAMPGLENSNAPWAPDRDRGLSRAEDRMSSQGLAHEKADEHASQNAEASSDEKSTNSQDSASGKAPRHGAHKKHGLAHGAVPGQ